MVETPRVFGHVGFLVLPMFVVTEEVWDGEARFYQGLSDRPSGNA
jgi:hypothetical protein